MSQTILEPNPDEIEWIASNLQTMRTLIQQYTATSIGEGITLRALDVVWSAWLSQHDNSKEDPNPLINSFGIAFGQSFVDKLGFSWVIVTDEHGTEIAVHGQPNDFLVFPPNFSPGRGWKRVE